MGPVSHQARQGLLLGTTVTQLQLTAGSQQRHLLIVKGKLEIEIQR